MGWKRRLGSSLALLHLINRLQPVPAAAIGGKSSAQVRGGPSTINSASVAFAHGSAAAVSGKGVVRGPKLGALHAEQTVLQRPSLRWRRREVHRRGRCLMGVKGLTSYVDQNLRAAAPIEHLREVRVRCVANVGRVPANITCLWRAIEMLLSIDVRSLSCHYWLS